MRKRRLVFKPLYDNFRVFEVENFFGTPKNDIVYTEFNDKQVYGYCQIISGRLLHGTVP